MALESEPAGNVTVTVRGAAGTDLTPDPASLTFTKLNWIAPQTVTVTAGQDHDVLDEEDILTHTVSSSRDGIYDGLGAGDVTVTVTDNDRPPVTVSFESATYSPTEGDSFEVTVILSGDPERTVVVPLTRTEQGGASVDDYSGVPANVTFNAGETEKSFTFTAIPDEVDDDGKSVELRFGSPPADGVSAGYIAESIVSIEDDDVPSPVTVSFGAGAYYVLERGAVQIVLTLDDDPERTVVIPLSRTNLGGASDADYRGVPASVTFNAGETEKVLTFTATHNRVDDDGKSVELGFDSPPAEGVIAGSISEAIVSITDDDRVGITVTPRVSSGSSLDDIIFDEGGGAKWYSVVLDSQPTEEVTVRVYPNTTRASGRPTWEQFFRFTPRNWHIPRVLGIYAPLDNDTVGRLSNIFSSAKGGDYERVSGDTLSVRGRDLDVRASFGLVEMQPVDEDAGTVRVTVEGVTIDEGAPRTDFAVRLSTSNSTATGNSDFESFSFKKLYFPNDGFVEFVNDDGETRYRQSATYEVVILDDGIKEDTEAFYVTMYGTGGRYAGALIDDDHIELTINDNDPLAVMVDPGTLEIDEGTSDTYDVALDTQPAGDVTVTIDGITGTDLTLDKTTLTFTALDWNVTQTVTVTAEQDDDQADDPPVILTHTLSSLAVDLDDLSAAEVSVTVTDDDTPVEMPVAYSLVEVAPVGEDAGAVRVEVVAETNEDGAPSIDYAVRVESENGTARSPGDYEAVDETLVFPVGDFAAFEDDAGETRYRQTVTFDVVIHDNIYDEDAETFLLKLSESTGYDESVFAVAQIEVTINDDDTAGVTVTPTVLEVEEGVAATYTVVLDTRPSRDVRVTINDPANTDVTAEPARVTFTPDNWDEPRTVTVWAAQDSDATDEAATAITHTITSTFDQYDGLSADSVTVTVTDDDGPAVTVSFEQATYSVAESDDSSTANEQENEVTVKVTLSADPERTVDIPLVPTNQGGATDADYSGVPPSVTFNAGDIEKSITFTATDDAEDDDEESVKLTFGTLPGGVSAGSVSEAVVSITDDDVPAVTVSFDSSSYEVAEGSTMTVEVTLSEDPKREVIIPIKRTNQYGASDSDYSGVPPSLTFNAGEIVKSFTFIAAADNLNDVGERVKLEFGPTLPPRVSAGTIDEATVSITNVAAQVSPSINFGFSEYVLTEGEMTTVTVTLSAAPGSETIIPINRVNRGRASDDDYSGVLTSVRFGPMDTEKSFTITADDDAEDDDGESVKLTFGALPSGVSAGTTTETTVTINDNDDPAVTVRFELASYSVSESDDASTTDKRENEVTVRVTLSADPERAVEILLILTNQGASVADYSGVPTSVTFGPTDTEKIFTFTAADDAEDDDGESVKLSFDSPLPDGVSAGTIDETTVSITDDDDPSVTVSFELASYSVSESDDASTVDDKENEVTVKVTLNAAPERGVIIPIETEGRDGATSADYSVSALSIGFGATDTEKSITFTAVDDAEDDDGESVKLSFDSPLPDGVSTGSISETTVSITDDDVPAVSISKASLEIEEGDSDTYEVELDTQPTGDVTVTIGGTTGTDLTLDKDTLTFSEQNWDQPQTVTVTADHDDDAVDEAEVTLTHTVSSPDDGDYANLSAPGVTVTVTDDDPAVEVSFEQSTYTVAEGSGVTVKVKLNAEPERTVDITLILTNQGGAGSDDYSLSATTLTFGPTDTEKTFTFTAADDAEDDDGESVKLSFDSPLPDGVSAGTTHETTVSITDNDDRAVEVSFEQSTYTVAEGSGVTVKVKLNAEPERTVDITLILTNQGGAGSDDYSLSATTLTFGPTDMEKTFTFTAADDAEDDDGESVKLSFDSALPAEVSRGSVPETTVSITDDDVPSVTVSFDSATYPVDEGDTVTVTVTLSAAPEREVVVPIDTTDEDGASSADYSLSETSVTFGLTDIEKTFTFTATQDTVDDDGESVKLTFGSALPAGVSRGSVPETTVSINDDDAPSSLTVNFEASTYNVTEGSTVEVVLTLDDDPEREVIIPFSKTNQGGASDSDYVGVPTSVIFNAGEISKSFEFSAASDRIGDPGEKVSFKLENLPQGTTAGTTSETVVTIEDVEPQGSTTVSFGADTYGVSEGSSTTITVVMSHAPGSDAVIPLSTTNLDGATGDDYSGVPASLTFGPTDMEKTFTFTATQDSDDDDGESVKLTFDSPLPTGVSAGTTYETTVSITDDDVPAVTVSFELATYNVAESDDASTVDKRENEVTVKVTLSVEPERTVDITLIPANQGASDDDYSLSATTLTFGPTDMEKTFTFTAADDAEDDDGESVKLTFGSALPAGVSRGSVPETTVSITDDDVPSVTVSFDSATYPVDEGDTVTVTVTLSAAPEREVVVPIDTTDEDGASSADYSLSETSVTFGLTDIEKTFTFTATQDTVDDDGESVKLSFGSVLPEGVSRGSVPETTVSITDDDVPSVTVSFDSATYPVDEGDTVTVTVTLSAAPEREVVVPIDTTDEDGASSADYSLSETSVTFGLTDIEKTFTFTATQDTVDDDGESVKLTFGSALPAGVSRGSVPETTVSITDDDVPSVTVSFDSATYPVDEGDTVTVTVTLSAAPEREVVVPIDTTDEDGASSADYSLSETSVTFGPTDIEKTFTFTAAEDTVDDDGESVKLSFDSALPAGVSRGSVPETTVSITDDDVPSVTVSFDSATYPVDEGDTVTVTVTLSAAPEREVVVPIDTTDEDGASSADYSLSETSVTFGLTDIEKTFTFTATQDTVDDDGESVKLTFGSALPEGVSQGTPNETVVSINDDDAPSSLTVNFEASTYNVTEGSTVEVVLTLDDDPERR